jgi:GT2 family glycosyltransferase
MPREPAAVVVASHERPELLARTMPAVRGQLADGDELVVVDHGPKAKSAKLNLGIASCAQPVLVLTDDDCAIPPGWLDAMVAPFADPAVGAAFGPVVGLTAVPGGSGPPTVSPGPAPFVTWTYAHGAAMAVRRVAVESVGGFDERLGPGAPAHGEEHDLLLRIRERGWTCVIADAPPVEHVHWRDDDEELSNLFVYERGAGAFLGAAVRRSPADGARLLKARLHYLRGLYRDRATRGRWFGPAATKAFAGGLVYGLRMRPRALPTTRSRSVGTA